MRKPEPGGLAPRDLALRLLAHRAYSRTELERKLTQRGVSAEAWAETADWLTEMGLLSDEDYALQIVRSYAARGWGYYKVRQELLRRGVSRDLWDPALEALPDPADTLDALLAKRLEPDADEAQIQKCADTLLRRGFARRDVTEALNRRGCELWDE